MKIGLTAIIGGLAFWAAAAGAIAAPANAQDRDTNAEAWVQEIADDATAMLSDPETSALEAAGEFHNLLSEKAAMRNFGRSALGAYSRTIGDDDFDQFVALLEQYGAGVVQGRFSEYAGQSIMVRTSTVDERENFAYVGVESDILRANGSRQASVRWLLLRRGDAYRIYDITVETLDETATFSLLQTQREEFQSVLRSNGDDFDALFEYLREGIVESGVEPVN